MKYLYLCGIVLGIASTSFGLGINNAITTAFGMITAVTGVVGFGAMTLKEAINALASETREAFTEQNLRINGLRDMVNGLDGDHNRLQAEVDKLDLDQLKKFESRLQFVESLSNVRSVYGNKMKDA